MKKIIKDIIPYIVIVLVVVLIRTFLVTPVIVSGDSMVPTLKERELLLLNKIKYRFNDIKRFDVVVVKLENKEIIKRVIGLPGEEIVYRNNTLYVDGHEVPNEYTYNGENKKENFDTKDFSLKTICNCNRIPEGKYLVLGDNREVSADSRMYGLFDREDIEGRVKLSIWPIKIIK